LLKVLHKKPGDTFDAGVLGGKLGRGRIEEAADDGSLLFSLDLEEAPPPRLPVRLGVGFPRPIQLKRLLRDLSNLGVEAVDLLETDLGEKSYRDTKLLLDGGARAAMIEGAVQARDTGLPRLSVYSSLEAWLAEKPWAAAPSGATSDALKPGNRTAALFGAPVMPPFCGNTLSRATSDALKPLPGTVAVTGAPVMLPFGGNTLSRATSDALLVAADNVRPEGSFAALPTLKQAVVLAIGPERGWSDRERDLFGAAGFARLSLGGRALRTETACVAAVILGAWRFFS
jgi:16S rRNA U1498 N3-methylase RsmE